MLSIGVAVFVPVTLLKTLNVKLKKSPALVDVISWKIRFGLLSANSEKLPEKDFDETIEVLGSQAEYHGDMLPLSKSPF